MSSLRLPRRGHSLLCSLIALTVLLSKAAASPSDGPAAGRAMNADRIIAEKEKGELTSEDAGGVIDDPLPEMPLLPITSRETVRACRELRVSPRDVFVCSYPKSGTTWTQNIVVRLLWEIANNNNGINGRRSSLPEDWHLSHSAPFYEVDQYWRQPQQDSQKKAEKNDENNKNEEPPLMERLPAQTPILGSPGNDNNILRKEEYRVFNTHLLPHQLPPNAKCVYVVRDPLDVMVSFYHHLSNQAVEDGGYTGTFEEFFEGFLDGTIVYGKWQDHIEAWLGGRRPKCRTNNGNSFLLLHYEDMKEDLARETKRLARFLSNEDEKNNESGNSNDSSRYLDEIVSAVVPHCTFDAMKRERKRYTPLTVSWRPNPETGKPYDEFVRKGRVGDGREFLLRTLTSSALRDRWIRRDVPIARGRWKKAGVEQEITDRYL